MADGAVIIGAGMAGLSAAFHMGKGCQLFEADDLPGGLMRTQTINGYSFDCTGHLLHLKDDYARRFVTGLLKGNLAEHTRKAGIYSKGVFTGYPFQANTYGLPADVEGERGECFPEIARGARQQRHHRAAARRSRVPPGHPDRAELRPYL
ncbi:MAG: NAD(P)-binding protein [Nitrospirota bacterium]